MQKTFQLTIILFLSVSAMAVCAQDDNASLINEKFKIIEGHQKNLDENYQNKLKDLDVKFENKSDWLDIKLKAIDSRLELLTWIFGILAIIFGTVFGINIYSIYKAFKKIPEIAEAKAKEKFEQHFEKEFEKEFEKRFQAKEKEVKELIRVQKEVISLNDEETQFKKHKKILVFSKQGADDQFIKAYLDEMGFKNTNFETFDPNQIYTDKDLILFNDQDKEHPFQVEEVIAYAQAIPEKTIIFYFGGQRIPMGELGDNFTFANIKMQLYGNLMNALRFQKIVQS